MQRVVGVALSFQPVLPLLSAAPLRGRVLIFCEESGGVACSDNGGDMSLHPGSAVPAGRHTGSPDSPAPLKEAQVDH